MKKTIPESLENIDHWNLSRRKFLKGLALVGIASQIPFLNSCWNDDDSNENTVVLDKDSSLTLKAVQEILFPKDGFGPDTLSIKAYDYFLWALADQQMDDKDKKFIINGIKWTNELAEKEYSKAFHTLNPKEQKLLIIKIIESDWGETWLSVVMTFILEALLSNPLYGGNTNQEAWEWLEHYPSFPQPTKELLYPQIFKTLEETTL